MFDLLSREYRGRLTVEDLTAAFDDQCRRYGVPEAVAGIQEPRSASPSPGAVGQVTRVDMRADKAGSVMRPDVPYSRCSGLRNGRINGTKSVAIQYVPACLASDSDDFHAGFDYVASGSALPWCVFRVLSRRG